MYNVKLYKTKISSIAFKDLKYSNIESIWLIFLAANQYSSEFPVFTLCNFKYPIIFVLKATEGF